MTGEDLDFIFDMFQENPKRLTITSVSEKGDKATLQAEGVITRVRRGRRGEGDDRNGEAGRRLESGGRELGNVGSERSGARCHNYGASREGQSPSVELLELVPELHPPLSCGISINLVAGILPQC